MAQRIACARERTFGNLSTLYFQKAKKKFKFLYKASLSLNFKELLQLKQKTTSFLDSDIYTQYYP